MLASLLEGLHAILPIIGNILTVLILASVVMDWVNADPYNPYVQLTRQLTEPIFKPFRRITNRFSGPFDFAPLFAMFTIHFLQVFLTSYLAKLIRVLS